MNGLSGDFPKLLIAAEFPPNSAGGGGALVRQMLLGYPSTRVSSWSCLGAGGPAFQNPAARSAGFQIPVRLVPHHRARGLKSAILEKLWTPFAAAHLRATLRRENPDQIWAILFGWAIPVFAAAISGTHKFHVSLWDSPVTASRRAILGASRAARMSQQCFDLFARATTRDVIGGPMRDYAEAISHRRAELVIHSGIEPEQLRALRVGVPPIESPIRIAFAGTVVERESFKKVVAALRVARANLSSPLELLFFGPRSDGEEWFDSSWMREFPALSEAEFLFQLSRCSWGMVVMELTDANPEYNQFSFPNKIGSYISAGLPILAFGHRTSSIARFMGEHAAGVCCASSDSGELQSFLVGALSGLNPRLRYRSEILKCAETEFNAARMRRELWKRFGVRGA